MEKLIKMVSEKASITEDQAKIAIETVASFVKEKLPPGFGGQIDKFLNSDAESGGGIMDQIGNIFGK